MLPFRILAVLYMKPKPKSKPRFPPKTDRNRTDLEKSRTVTTLGIGIGIGQYYSVLGIGCLFWYCSNPILRDAETEKQTKFYITQHQLHHLHVQSAAVEVAAVIYFTHQLPCLTKQPEGKYNTPARWFHCCII